MPTALVTGAGGFLGRYIVRELAAAGWRVTGVDRTSLPPAEISRLGMAGIHVLTLPAPAFEKLLVTLHPEVVVHAAGPASVPESVENPSADFDDSVPPLRGILETVRRCEPACRVLFLSSAAVYGNAAGQPIAEDAVLRPISPYGFHKLIGEYLITEYARVYGVRGCSVRIFSAYGPGLRRQVLWDISRKLLHQPIVELLGTGEETRDFIHAADVARGVRAVIGHGAFRAEAYNLASGRATSISDLARMLANALGRRPEIAFSGTRRKGDPLHWHGDVGRVGALGFIPKVSIADGVAEYAAWILGIGA